LTRLGCDYSGVNGFGWNYAHGWYADNILVGRVLFADGHALSSFVDGKHEVPVVHTDSPPVRYAIFTACILQGEGDSPVSRLPPLHNPSEVGCQQRQLRLQRLRVAVYRVCVLVGGGNLVAYR
jgi:hypothetical protein